MRGIGLSLLLLALSFPGTAKAAGKVTTDDTGAPTLQFWFPERLNLSPLRQQGVESNPMEKSFDYNKEFRKLDLKAVKKDIASVLTETQDWWPADYGNGPHLREP